jgi:hypothetical protein
MSAATESTILGRILGMGEAELSLDRAQFLLGLTFPPADRERLQDLSARERKGPLGVAEEAELAAYRRVAFLLIRLQDRARQVLATASPPAPPSPDSFEIPPGIKRSQVALRRDLPKLLENPKLLGQWAAYHGDERIGIARTETELIRECLRRGFKADEYYVSWIHPLELIEEEELDPPPPCRFDDEEDDDLVP